MAKEQGISKEITDAVQSIVMAVFACCIYNRSEIGTVVPVTQKTAFSEFFASARQNKALGSQATVMVQLAAAFVNGCPV